MKTLRRILYALASLLLAGLTAAGALWLWSDTDTSLAGALNQLARLLPAGQTLEVKDVKGTIRSGGSIGWLRWQQGKLSVEASDVTSVWSATALLGGELRLPRIDIHHLRVEDQRAATPPTAPTDLRLPLRVDASFSVATLEWVGPPALEASDITGRYRFDGLEHGLDVGKVRISSGTYGISARLQALAPMTLVAQLQGSVQTTLPKSKQSLTANAKAELKGPLAGRDASLELLAQLTPESNSAAGAAMQASASAQIQPWQTQPIASAQLNWKAINLAALWPQAPQTLLDGEASVAPAGPDWRASIELGNAQAGQWNLQHLPLDSLKSELEYRQGQWTLKSLQARGAGGSVEAQGNLSGAASDSSKAFRWQGSASLHAINPALIDSRLALAVLDGQVRAQQAPTGIAFDAHLQAATQPSAARTVGAPAGDDALDGLRLKSVRAQGLWLAPNLKLDTLLVQTDEAQLQGQLSLHTVSLAARGAVTLTLPGAQVRLEGQMASTSGQGEIDVKVDDASLLSNWLRRWPGSPAWLRDAAIKGGAEMTGRWQGGWQRQGRDLQIEASLHAARLDLRAPGEAVDQVWHLHELQAGLSGTLAAWKLKAQGLADQASRRFALATQAHGGHLSEGVWQAQLDSAQLSAGTSQQPASWTLQLGQSLGLNWRQSGTSHTLEIAPGSARLSAGQSGTAVISWQQATWSRQGKHSQWQTQGAVQGVPLAWLDQLGNNAMSRLGLSGDLLLAGQWQASGPEALLLRATLERSSGDLLLQTDEASVGTLHAGLKDAQVLVTANGERLAASLRWDSARAGQARADFSSHLLRQGDNWTWPMDAPVSGTLQAKLPPLADWSRLAPPGWRLRGTLDGKAELSGTRGAPQWHGSLLAQDLALSSVADGIDFSKGTLRANIEGQRLEIVEFSLSGAGAKDPGRLLATGSLDWLPAATAASSWSSRLRMTLDFQADALNMSAAADRRLVLSGQLSARLADARLTLRGALTADQALFVLPEDTAPTLGDDVILRSKGAAPTPGAPSSTPVSTRAGVTPDILVSLDFGKRFRVRGHGLSTRLGGKLELRSNPDQGRSPLLTGELRTAGGSYKAYGQNLNIEAGVLRFEGPYDNPNLDILAIRPNLQQRVGVRINGTALAPVVRLYADPDLPDAEKLSWLVLGRSAANGGSETALLQQAALSLIGNRGYRPSGGLARSLGIDELSLGSSASSNTTGTSAADTTVRLGKHVSRNFFVAYEHGLNSTMGTFYIFYELSRQFTVRAQTGEQSAVDLIFTLRYD